MDDSEAHRFFDSACLRRVPCDPRPHVMMGNHRLASWSLSLRSSTSSASMERTCCTGNAGTTPACTAALQLCSRWWITLCRVWWQSPHTGQTSERSTTALATLIAPCTQALCAPSPLTRNSLRHSWHRAVPLTPHAFRPASRAAANPLCFPLSTTPMHQRPSQEVAREGHSSEH